MYFVQIKKPRNALELASLAARLATSKTENVAAQTLKQRFI